MRILHILDHSIPLQSGYAFRTRAILAQQHRFGWSTVHLTSPKQGVSPAMEEIVDGLLFHRTPPSRSLLADVPVLRYLDLMGTLRRRILELALRYRPDILHAHSPVLNAWPAIAVGRKLNIPVVYEVRAFWEDAAADHGTSPAGGPRYRLTRGLETLALRHADAVTTICEGLRRDMLGRGMPPEKVTLIPNAVDIDNFSRPCLRDDDLTGSLNLGGKHVVGFIGSFYAYEGLSLLVDALPAVLARVPEAHVLLVGGGPEEARLRAHASLSGLADKITFTGRVRHDEVNRYYGLIDVFAYPRLAMRLTELVTPLKPLESMAGGHAVIASDVAGHGEIIRDGETGLLFRAGDAGALAEAIVRLLSDSEARARLGGAAREYVMRERTWQKSVAAYGPVYEQLRRG